MDWPKHPGDGFRGQSLANTLVLLLKPLPPSPPFSSRTLPLAAEPLSHFFLFLLLPQAHAHTHRLLPAQRSPTAPFRSSLGCCACARVLRGLTPPPFPLQCLFPLLTFGFCLSNPFPLSTWVLGKLLKAPGNSSEKMQDINFSHL